MDLISRHLRASTLLLIAVIGMHAILLEDNFGYWYAQPFFAYVEISGVSVVTALYALLLCLQGKKLRSRYSSSTVILSLMLMTALTSALIHSIWTGVLLRGSGTGLLDVRVAMVAALLYLTLSHYFDNNSVERIVRAFIFITVSSSLFHLIVYALDVPIYVSAVHEYGRSTAFESGILLSWCMAFCFCLSELLLNRKRALNILFCGILFLGVMLSFRRFFILLELGGMAVVFFSVPSSTIGAAFKRRSIMIAVCSLLLLIAVWRSPDIIMRMDPTALLDTGSESYARSYSSNAGHLSDVQMGLELLRGHYVFGIGLGVPFEVQDGAPIVGSMLHSQHLHTWLRTGLIGILTLTAFYLVIWWRARYVLMRTGDVFSRAFALMVLGVTMPHYFISFIGPPFYLQQKALFYFIFLFVVIEQLGQNIRRAVRVPTIQLP